MKLHDTERTDSEATIVSSPSIVHSDDSSTEEICHLGKHKFKILYSCSNEPKNYRTNTLPSICKKDCGEDAYFELDQSNFMVFGIADGVGGWNKSGVDPSLFAWDLMNSCKEVSEDLDDWPDPKTVLIDGYDMVVRKKEVKAGSSTACILTLDKVSGIVYSTNLGDSGFTVIRDNKVIFQTQEQQHYFNAPYQLSIIPDTSIAYLQNTPHDAYDDQFTAEEGDVIVLGTDGLWDNMYHEDIINIIKDDINNIKESKAEVKNKEEYDEWEKETSEVLSGLSFQLTQQAKKYSQDWYRESPFSKKFNNAGQYYSGG
ncbi:protein serine/threonine phosphatase 2C [Anaeromyces robustus]|uniref:Protein phosphatase n=1 Tax=Anaeromyces robustus TaxID=1754192 RepID=A0A1Y1WTZ5_9FUNG|nr:protein serine/threonine phosphatase 2C [Anaeromyces robustus]|eukprot:ORX76983.1 protein serine/threonine phosphatase 2C [Anaeromyces robustus]